MPFINPHSFNSSWDFDKAIGFSLTNGTVGDFILYATSGKVILVENAACPFILNKNGINETKFCIKGEIGSKYIIINPIIGRIN